MAYMVLPLACASVPALLAVSLTPQLHTQAPSAAICKARLSCLHHLCPHSSICRLPHQRAPAFAGPRLPNFEASLI